MFKFATPTFLTKFVWIFISLSAFGVARGQNGAPRSFVVKQRATQYGWEKATADPGRGNMQDQTWRQLQRQASELASQGKYDDAILMAERARSLAEKAVGKHNEGFIELSNNLADLYFQKGDYPRAERLLIELVTLADGLASTNPGLAAGARNNLGVVYAHEGKYALAESMLKEALRLREAVKGPDDPEVGVTLTYLGEVKFRKSEYTEAANMYERALSILNKKPDHFQLEIAILHNNTGLVYVMTGRYDLAAEAFQQSLTIHRRIGGEINPEVATVLGNLGAVYKAKADYVKAESSYSEALNILTKLWGETPHVDIARAWVYLSSVYMAIAEYAKAEQALLKALEIYKHVPAVNPDSIAIAKNDLAMVYRSLGKTADARELLEDVLSFYEREFGPKHLKTAPPLNNLATLAQDMGEYERARQLFGRAVSVYEESGEIDPTMTAAAEQNLAGLDILFNDYSTAEQRLKRAHTLYLKVFGTAKHPVVGTVLNNLGVVFEAQGRYEDALQAYKQSLTIREETLRPGHPDIAIVLNNLGLLQYKNGHYSDAEQFLKRAIKMFGETGVGDNANAISIRQNLAFTLWAESKTVEAVQTITLALELSEQHLSRLIAVGSSSQKRLYADTLLTESSGVITMHLLLGPDNPELGRLAFTTILRRKGRVLDTMIDQASHLRRNLRPQDQAMFVELAKIYGRLSSLESDVPRIPGEDVSRLRAEAARLEAQLSKNSREFEEQFGTVTLERVQQALPTASALVEFVWYRPLDVKAKKESERYGVPRYAAYVLHRNGPTDFVDLGQAPLADAVLLRLRAALRNPNNQDVKQLARILDKALMEPVRKLLRGERQIFLSPDGLLNLIPFGALVDEQDRYLIESYSFTYLTSGRDLLRQHTLLPARQASVVIANPQFGDKKQMTPASSKDPTKTENLSNAASTRFDPLSGTEEEGRRVSQLLNVTPLTGTQATESAVKTVTGPRVLHIATHGFFLPYQERESAIAETADPFRSVQFRAIEENKSTLLRSGLAFAGANLRVGGNGEDGILTALEATSLDLWGTKLVVLSACETGLGDVQIGEGIYGLRRALLLAGAESAVISFWKVDDEVTRDLIVQYYKRLLAGGGRSEALRSVQRELLGNSKYRHPYYWASFIHLGDWRTLDGKVAN